MSGIYAIKNIVNDKRYIGSTKKFRKRKSDHFTALNRGIHPNKHLQSAWDKYGAPNFVYEIVEIVPDSADLVNREQYWMDVYISYERDRGYNICPKADRTIVSEETRKKQSEQRKGKSPLLAGWRHTDEAKQLISVALKGQKKPPMSSQAKEKIGEWRKGKSYEELYGPDKAIATREAIACAHRGRRGENHWNYGRTASDETRAKMRLANLGKSRITIDGRKRLSESKKGEGNPNFIPIDESSKSAIILSYSKLGYVSKELVSQTGLSRYKINLFLKQLGLWKGNRNGSKTSSCGAEGLS